MVGFWDRDIPAEVEDRAERRKRLKKKRKITHEEGEEVDDDDDDDDDVVERKSFQLEGDEEKNIVRTQPGPCSAVPNDGDKNHTWTKYIYGESAKVEAFSDTGIDKEYEELPSFSNAWEEIEGSNQEEGLEFPKSLDHRFFHKGGVNGFVDSLFAK